MLRRLTIVFVATVVVACSNGGKSASTTPTSADAGQGVPSTVGSPSITGLAGGSLPLILSVVEGAPLGRTDLRLLADNALLNVDEGTTQPISGLPPIGDDIRWAQRVDAGLLITVDCLACNPRPNVFIVRSGSFVARPVATGFFVTPALDGLWAKSYEVPTNCEMSRIGLDGEVIQAPRPIDCALQPVEETELGLIAFSGEDWLLVSPSDFTEIQRWRSPTRPYAVLGTQLLIGDDHQFTLVDPERSSTRRVAAPPARGHPSYGLVSPDGRSVAIEYRSTDQVMDLWLLDVQSMHWVHMPSMPVRASIKRPEPTWTSDGRLAVVGDFNASPESRHLLIVWRPGETSLELREVTQDASFIA